MKYIYLSIFVICSLIFHSCQQSTSSEIDGYESLGKGIYYQIVTAQGDGITPQNNDLALFHTTIRKGETIVASTYETNILDERFIGEANEDYPIEAVIKLLSIGDSASIILEVDSLYNKPKVFGVGEKMMMGVKLMNIEFASERVEVQKTILSSFKEKGDGFYYTFHKNVEGTTPNPGDHVTCNVVMRNNNRVKLKTGDKGLPKNVIIPKAGEVTTPLHKAIQLMSVGDSLTVGIETNNLPGQAKGFYEGDIMEVDIVVLDIKDPVTAEEEIQAATALAAKMKKEVEQKANTIPQQIIHTINDYKEGKLPVSKHQSNLEYIVLKEGTGPKKAKGQKVAVHYSGHFLDDGKKFDSSFDRGQPYRFTVGRKEVIEGWDTGLQLLNVGSEAVLFVPHYMAYGDKGFGNVIPARANLVFYVEVVE